MNIHFRKATHDDVPNIIRLLADDPLGSEREKYVEPLPSQYYAAFVLDPDGHNVEAVFRGGSIPQ